MDNYTTKDVERFWSHVDKKGNDDCWNWIMRPHGGGYGRIKIKKKEFVASRFAYMLTNGEIPKGMFVCHKCDNPSCCNPFHLFLGRPIDNVNDMVAKKRHQHGETHSRHKLTWDEVSIIRELYDTGGISQYALAKEFNVTRPQIGYIVRNVEWRIE